MEADSKTISQITVFWSWQSDSPAKENRNFIGDCLSRAAKQIGKENAIIINVDRDTKGKGGSPAVADTIFAKIRNADVFVWDATLVHSDPRPSPNANVLIEFGYALAVLGEGRIIGVMNVDGKPGGDALPFDLKHRRWPISYSFADSTRRDNLVSDLAKALRDALKEPKDGAFFSDIDFNIVKKLWSIIDSPWITYWHDWRLDHPQYEKKEDRVKILKYLDTVDLPEYTFRNETLKTHHKHFVESVKSYALTAAIEMAVDGPAAFVINAKANPRWRASYDDEYERECKVLMEKIELLWSAWMKYLEKLRLLYPEIVFSNEL